ncbi:acyl-CoA dehydrogenase family protein [Bordetella petrii]|uniref:acyl-CoA dehydrogenase family protein n=1 Tax=Bordetella petrii TaxID=94624 RepID=UPI001A972F5B|nr:acyl-CoA dehydrogenase family protein [Bordetella petrii]MBO1112483.1 acyl-CoA dehydrogenase family protein [Bordetella petrii]
MDSLFGDSAHRLFAQAYPTDVLRAAERGQAPDTAWQAVEASGFLDALLPEAAGGAGLRLADVAPLAQAAGWHGVGAPVIQTMLARAWLHAAGHAPRPGPIALAPWTAPGADGLQARAVGAARAAQWVLAAGPDADGARLLAVADAQAVPSGGHGSLDADLCWPSAVVAAAAPLNVPDTALQDLAATACAGLIAGALERILQLTVEYASQRTQFGKPIGRFQAVQQQISVLAEQVWAVRAAAQLAFQSQDWMPRPLLAAQGKARASAAVARSADIAHAVHGAIGITAEYELQCYTRRLREWRHAAGGEQYWNARIGRHALAARELSALDYVRTCLYAVAE